MYTVSKGILNFVVCHQPVSSQCVIPAWTGALVPPSQPWKLFIWLQLDLWNIGQNNVVIYGHRHLKDGKIYLLVHLYVFIPGSQTLLYSYAIEVINVNQKYPPETMCGWMFFWKSTQFFFDFSAWFSRYMSIQDTPPPVLLRSSSVQRSVMSPCLSSYCSQICQLSGRYSSQDPYQFVWLQQVKVTPHAMGSLHFFLRRWNIESAGDWVRS